MPAEVVALVLPRAEDESLAYRPGPGPMVVEAVYDSELHEHTDADLVSLLDGGALQVVSSSVSADRRADLDDFADGPAYEQVRVRGQTGYSGERNMQPSGSDQASVAVRVLVWWHQHPADPDRTMLYQMYGSAPLWPRAEMVAQAARLQPLGE